MIWPFRRKRWWVMYNSLTGHLSIDWTRLPDWAYEAAYAFGSILTFTVPIAPFDTKAEAQAYIDKVADSQRTRPTFSDKDEQRWREWLGRQEVIKCGL